MLPEFSYSSRVSADAAKVDLIEIEIGTWIFTGDVQETGLFFGFLGPYPTNETAQRMFTVHQREALAPEQFGWMYNRPKGELAAVTRIELKGNGRGSGSTKAGVPLAQGYMKVTDPDRSSFRNRKLLKFVLKMNPTRFVRHQEYMPEVDAPFERWSRRLPWPNFQTRNIPVQNSTWVRDREAPLDHKDNVLIDERSLAFARPEAWPLHMRRYFEAFEYEVEESFIKAHDAVRPPTRGQRGNRRRNPLQRAAGDKFYNLKVVEHYWEFTTPNPTREVRVLEKKLFAVGLSSSTREFPDKMATMRLEGNSRSIHIGLPGGRQLRVYAKTTKRLRFEIIHDLKHKSIARLLSNEGSSKTTHSLDELLGWFPLLADDAARTLNNVLTNLEEDNQDYHPSATKYQLISDVLLCLRDEARARAILQLLVENGRVSNSQNDSEFLPEIEKLRRKDILILRLGANWPTPYYRKAVKSLNAQDLDVPLAWERSRR